MNDDKRAQILAIVEASANLAEELTKAAHMLDVAGNHSEAEMMRDSYDNLYDAIERLAACLK